MPRGSAFNSQFEVVPNRLFIPKENEVLVRIAEGKTFRVIAVELGMREKTTRWYMGRINEKLDVNDKAAAVCRAFCLGILRPLCVLLMASQVMLIMGMTSNQPTRPVRTQPRVLRVVRSGRSIAELSEIRV